MFETAGLRRPWWGAILAAFAAVAIAGCAQGPRTLMPTPAVYSDQDAVLFGDLPGEYSSSNVELIYVTDRAPETNEAGELYYGSRRSHSLGIGTTVVDLGHNASWEELVEASSSSERAFEPELNLVSIDEFARLPPTPIPFEIIDGEVVDDPEVVAAVDAGLEKLRAALLRRLALTDRKDIFIYVHGYHNVFEDAAFALAELWHFFGREGLPIVYTWPAGFPGLFGYTYDRESSEFTVFHLKQTIQWLADQPEVENIHLIAHSRGTDVAISAFRELVLENRNREVSVRDKLKVANIVVAAPDLDVEVITQRVAAERLSFEVDQVTLYSSPGDNAIAAAERLFASPRGRLGTLAITELSPEEQERMKHVASHVTIVNFTGESTGFGHSYFRTNPAVSSDIILKLRYGLEPGDPGRPLEHIGLNFWKIPEGYPGNVQLTAD